MPLSSTVIRQRLPAVDSPAKRGGGGELLELAVGTGQLLGALLGDGRPISDPLLEGLIELGELLVRLDNASGADQRSSQERETDCSEKRERHQHRVQDPASRAG